ncbi:MAG TPA: hypothetical protein PLX02_11575 [Syntrophorhabdaceae bacterium]|nr:hypothetical protein [Syntrophorhabdaceae bacterium]HQM82252.1 hypothetical protein [Syntrophorhabdaceae bacterium]
MTTSVRNFHGYEQIKLDGRWMFIISGFESYGRHDRCSVRKADGTYDRDVPINSKDRILIAGKWYGRRYWYH